MVTIRRRLHVTGFAEQFGVVAGVFTTVAFGFTVMEVEIHRAAAALVLRSTFCFNLRLDFAPSLIVLGITEPDRDGRIGASVGVTPSWRSYVGF